MKSYEEIKTDLKSFEEEYREAIENEDEESRHFCMGAITALQMVLLGDMKKRKQNKATNVSKKVN